VLKGLEVLLVEPDPNESDRLCTALRASGVRVTRAADAATAWACLCDETPEVLVVASPLHDLPASEVARWRRAFDPAPDCVLLCEAPRMDEARAALRSGVRGYVRRGPDGIDELLDSLGEAAVRRRTPSDAVATFVGVSEAAERVRRDVRAAAAVDAPVLFSGETGVGKDVLARALHRSGPRAQGPFVPVNCAALPDALLEGELFGAERGAYTGSDRSRGGLVEAAAGGTLFLDEIGELSPSAQARLLRFLDAGGVRRLGATHERLVNVRIVAATHRDLRAEARAGRFRDDLRFRLDVVRIDVPPLRRRPADIPVLARHFAERMAGGPRLRLEPSALRELLAWRWPGNARELFAVLQRAAVLQGPVIRRFELPESASCAGLPALESLLRRHAGVLSAVASELGVSVRTVQRRVARAGLRPASYRDGSISIASDM
jgi:DNA-binding NtrC family response regulator